MATTTRSKYKQLAKEKEAEEENLAQEITEENENDSNYEYETDNLSEKSCVTVQEISISDISDVIIIDDDIETNKKSLSKKEKKPPTKTTKLKTSWVWRFFKFNENNTKVICQIGECGKTLAWCGSPSSMKTHLSDAHQITKAIAIKYQEDELINP
ncbi:hypothetical protein GLOIN_2v1483279 [Rhizophagus irregularis DAOM 181602=DAOM 197198]|uniref:BED-type domain-containing protein n=2 Tax=Rhizophagus irregularis TaxID=588596 RepID=A0A015LG70_RHIIW|nr:hypothetical protein GLOIN_2v1483279 [Rhizophagus irregularis DAOM 181602=DAOM 197198]EXX71576.1 hypothetical protein RirG_077250 [Rhizophagus irregularis DAOM 197198w]POG65174.1 hypothetical protein GLOIN_2v1483279 [Rhizophagus irregularis DAOM 181602=DAOM 197198]GBC52470.1 hypothetical protein GLOIN_2v1483279 [Rhizophagus irregularis DAOM 181602=DAOM 197198]CAG8501686.1 15475_t:CDS:1 [Rhizophagus irregularis]|eukprot:XP_025172040.1 hypothetical protein GLOIN_2v1483279 [Rhizophagus irregularis DAOM 181602=DAOM 197198]